MIIISQDKTTIINFDNVEFITKNDNSPYIYAKTNKAEIMIGKYKNEERALEVLNSLSDAIINNIFLNKNIYKMPEN